MSVPPSLTSATNTHHRPPEPLSRPVLVLAGIFVLCAALRLWLMLNAEVISTDGTTYILMAQRWLLSPSSVVHDFDYHVGYPVAIAGLHRLLTALGLGGGAGTWEYAGLAVSLLSALAATAALWCLAGMTLGWRVAWISAILSCVARKWASLGADVLSDSMAIAFEMWAIVFAVLATRALQRKSRSVIVLAAAVGVCVGAGYLVRPESLRTLVIACLLWLGYQASYRYSWKLTAASILTAALVTALCAAPYVVAIGALTKKKHIGDILPVSSVGGNVLAQVPVSDFCSSRALFNQVAEAMHPFMQFMVFVWIVAWLVSFHPKVPEWRRITPWPVGPGGWAILLGILMIVPILLGLHRNVHYLSFRHAMFLGLLLFPLAGAGIVFLGEFVAYWLPRTPPLQYAAKFSFAGFLLVAMFIHATQRPLHEGKACYRQAGQYLAQICRPGDSILVDRNWLLHYSQVPGRILDAQHLTDTNATYLAISDSSAAAAQLDLPLALPPSRFTEIHRISQPGKKPDSIHIYRINPASTPATRPHNANENRHRP